jgi:urea transport system substrate-binding protein
LARLLPPVVAQRLKTEKGPIADAFEDVTVVFADLVDFSRWSSTVAPAELVRILNCIFTAFDQLARRYGVEKISCFGDGYLAVAGLPVPRADHAVAAANLALAMRRAVRRIARLEGKALEVRIGLHSGSVVAGIVGERAFKYDVWGPAVNYASRMEALSAKGQIHLSQQTFEKIQDAFRLEERGLLKVKGFGLARTYWLKGPLHKRGSRAALGFPVAE